MCDGNNNEDIDKIDVMQIFHNDFQKKIFPFLIGVGKNEFILLPRNAENVYIDKMKIFTCTSCTSCLKIVRRKHINADARISS